MAAFRRVCAHAAVCAALLAATASLVRADVYDFGQTGNLTGKTFNGDTINFNTLGSAPGDVSIVTVLESTVTGGGLSIEGLESTSGISKRFIMSMEATTVDKATVTLSGSMPTNSNIRLLSTNAQLNDGQSLFDISLLLLQDNVSLIIENTVAEWPAGAANPGSVAFYGGGGSATGFNTKGSLFLLNATAKNAAAVLTSDENNAQNYFLISDNSAVAVDYCRCSSCTKGVVDMGMPLVVSDNSMFRVSHATVAGTTGGLLTVPNGATISGNSLFEISHSIVETGSLFDIKSDGEITATTGSVVSFVDLVGPSTGVSKDSAVPTTNGDDTVKIYGGLCVINDVELADIPAYKDNGLNINTLVDGNGLDSTGVCADVSCIPGNTIPSKLAEDCICTCSEAIYSLPACSSQSDPTGNYDSIVKCEIPHCSVCDRTNPDRCSECEEGYSINGQGTCDVVTTTTTTTTTAKPQDCFAAFCKKCVNGDSSTCDVCMDGYTKLQSICTSNYDGAAHPGCTAAATAAIGAFAVLYLL